MKYINWTKLIQLIAGIVLLAVLNAVLLGFLVKLGLEKGGEAAFGAKSEIAKLTLNIFDGNFQIYRWQVANKNAPMKNLFQIGRIDTRLNPEQLMYKRFVMNEIAIEDIQLGTTRNYSGALPIKIEKPSSSNMDLGKMTKSLQIDPGAAAKKVSEVDLKAKDQVPKIAKENEALLNAASSKVDAYKPENEIKAIDTSALNNISEAKTLPELQEKLKKLEDITKQAKAVQDNFNATKELADKNMSTVKANISKINELKEADLSNIFAKLDFGNYDLKAIGRSMLGPKINGYIDTGLNWFGMVQKYMPPKKAKPVKKKSERMKGLTIVYPNNKTLPRLLIRKISLSGKTAQETLNELTYSGQILNITSEPVLLGKPMTLDIRGKFTKQAASELKITGIFDHTKDTAVDNFDLYISGYSLKGVKLIDSIPVTITKGTGVIKGNLKFTDKGLSGKFSLIGRNLAFQNDAAKDDSFESLVASALSGAKEVQADIYLSGSLDNPEIKITTNLDKIISDKVNKVYGEKIDAARKQVEAEYNKQLGDAQQKAEAQMAAQQKAITDQLAKQQATVQKFTDDLAAKQKELQDQITNQQKGAVGDAEKKLKDALPKNLFR